MATTIEKIDRLIAERDSMTKNFNTIVFSYIIEGIIGVCDALNVEVEDVTLYNIGSDGDDYLIHLFVKANEINEELVVDLPKELLIRNDREEIKTFLQERMIRNSEEDNIQEIQERVLH